MYIPCDLKSLHFLVTVVAYKIKKYIIYSSQSQTYVKNAEYLKNKAQKVQEKCEYILTEFYVQIKNYQ